jgi:hypothetical protein
MTTIKINNKVFYPVLDIQDGIIEIHNDVVVGQLDDADIAYFKQQVEHDPNGIIWETLSGTYINDDCQFQKVRVGSIAPNRVVLRYISVSVKPKVEVKRIEL